MVNHLTDCVVAARASAGDGRQVSSTTSPVLRLIESEVTQLLQQYADVLNIPLPMYASILAETFYDQQQSRSPGGAVALTDSALAELSSFVRRNVQLHSRRTSL